MELTTEQKELIRDFETVKLGIKELKAKEEVMNAQIREFLDKDEEVPLPNGKLFFKKVPVFTYSPAVVQLKEELDVKKKEEEADGTAEMTYRLDLTYTTKKKKEGFETE